MKINKTTSVTFSKEQMFVGGASWSQLNCLSNSEHLSQLCFITQSSDCVTKYDCSLLRLSKVSLSSEVSEMKMITSINEDGIRIKSSLPSVKHRTSQTNSRFMLNKIEHTNC